jgi:hypothetical protein
MKIVKKIIFAICIIAVLYLWWIVMMNIIANLWLINSRSDIVNFDSNQIKNYTLPDEVLDAQCVKFILNGIETRKIFNDTIKEYSEKLWVDYYIVISAILGEQLRISCKWYRWELKDIIVWWTPTLFRSYDISVWLAWLKLWTAKKIRKDAIEYGYGDELKNISLSEEIISTDDKLSWKLATFLVKNIITRRQLSWYDISNNAGIVWTLYNMWNPSDKIPHDNPQIWWAIIDINGQKFTYGELSLWVYNYLKNEQ